MTDVFAIAATVTAWLDAGRDVLIARVLTGTGLAGREAAAVAAWPVDGDVGSDATVGSPLAARARAQADGAGSDMARADGTRADGAGTSRTTGRFEVTVSDDEAENVGLACGGRATVLVQRAADLPDSFWAAVRRGDPVALLDPAGTAGTVAFVAADLPAQPAQFGRVFGRGVSQVAEVDGGTLTTYWPRTRLLVVGGGPVAVALRAQADLLQWSATVAEDLASALDLLAGYGGADGVVVLSHDRDVDGPLLRAAVTSPVGYVGAMGSRHTQAARADWFAEHGVTDGLDRIHGPAGLDLGGFGPAEIALSIAAEIVALRSGRASRG